LFYGLTGKHDNGVILKERQSCR